MCHFTDVVRLPAIGEWPNAADSNGIAAAAELVRDHGVFSARGSCLPHGGFLYGAFTPRLLLLNDHGLHCAGDGVDRIDRRVAVPNGPSATLSAAGDRRCRSRTDRAAKKRN